VTVASAAHQVRPAQAADQGVDLPDDIRRTSLPFGFSDN
jgi:hypothetical protein